MSLAALWPWAIAAAVVGMLVCVLVAVLVLRAARAKGPMVPASAAPPRTATATLAASPPHDSGIAAALSIRQSFAEAQRALRQQTNSATDRNAIPWILSIGESDSGKSTMLDALALPRLPGVARSSIDAARAPALDWSFFEQGIVLDVAGSLVLDPAHARADDRAWNTLVAQLQRYRPERPLDAVVLTIPCTDLVGPQRLSRDALNVKATRLGDRVAELQHALSLRLPVYVVISKCDIIPGFTAFCRATPAQRHDDMLGWSSPYTIDSAFVPGWVDEAMDAVLRGIYEAGFGALARDETAPAGDALILFPMHLGRSRSPLRDCLQRIFRPTTYERGSFLRGIYFTGDRNAPAMAEEPLTAQATPVAAPPAVAAAAAGDAWAIVPDDASPSPTPRTEHQHQPAFLGDLFGEKVFAERGLAQPGARVFPSKNKLVARMQIAAAAIVLLGPFALYAGVNGVRIGPWRVSNGIRAQEASIHPLLQNIDVAVRQMEMQRKVFHDAANEGAPEVSVFHLLDNMAAMNTSHMWSVFMPGTLMSPLHSDITDAIGLSFQTIILPEFRDRLVYRTRRLVDPENTKPVEADGQFAVGLSLPQYLSEIDALGSSIASFNLIAAQNKGELQDLGAVVQYLYGEQMSPDFLQDAGYYRRALSQAHTKPIALDSAMRARAVLRAGELTHDSYTALLRRLTGTQMAPDSEDGPAASRADVEALNGLRAFLDTAGPVEQSLAQIHPSFVFGDDFPAQVRDSLAFYTGQLTGQLLPRYTDAAHTAGAVMHALDSLLRQPFMQAPATRMLTVDATQGAELSWEVARLDEALALHTGFDTFMAHGLDALPDVLRNRVRGLATVQLGAAMTDAIASAANVRGTATTTFADRDRDLTARITAFGQSSDRIGQLLDQLDAIGATTTYDALLDASTANAAALLARVDASLDLADRYRLPVTAVGSWNGRAPFSTNGFGGRPGALDEYLAAEQDAFGSAAQLARPLVTFLQAHADEDSQRATSLGSWEVVLPAVDQLDKKPATGPIASMASTLRLALDSIDVRDCARLAPRSASTGDLFARRADAMWSAVWRRCVDVSNRDVTTAYTRLQTTFRSRVAGRFPFSTADAPTEASAADIADMLRSYDAFVAAAKESGPPDAPVTGFGTRADAFLTDLGRVRTFFTAFLDSAAAGRPPMFDYEIDFRVNRAHEAGANLIAEWTADVGDQHAVIGAPVASRRGRWRAGDDIRVGLRWATGSPFVPADPIPAGASLGDASIAFATSGQWSLLRLLRQYQSDIPDPDGGQTLKFAVYTVRRGSSADAATVARAYLRMRLYNPDTKTEVAMPRFPTSAPDLAMDGHR